MSTSSAVHASKARERTTVARQERKAHRPAVGVQHAGDQVERLRRIVVAVEQEDRAPAMRPVRARLGADDHAVGVRGESTPESALAQPRTQRTLAPERADHSQRTRAARRPCSVPRDARVHVHAPAVDPAGEVQHAREPGGAEIVGDHRTARPVVAVHHDLRRRARAPRWRAGIVDIGISVAPSRWRDRVLPLLAHVEHDDRIAARETDRQSAAGVISRGRSRRRCASATGPASPAAVAGASPQNAA